MKKFNKTTLAILASLSIFSLAMLSCRPAIFKGVKIKAEPELKLNLGSKEFNIDEILDRRIKEFSKDNKNLKDLFRYKTREEDKDIKFMLHKPLLNQDFNMELNMQSSLEGFQKGLTQTLSDNIFNIPKIEQEMTYEVDLSELQNKINGTLSIPSETKIIIEPQTDLSIDIPIPIDAGTNFKTIKFGDASAIEILIEKSNASPNFKVDITKLTLSKEDGTSLSSWEGSSSTPKLDISNKDLPPKMTLNVTVKISGGNPAYTNTILTISPSISGKVKEASGLNLGNIEQDIVYQDINIGGNFEEAKIDSGSISIKKEPDFSAYGWKNIGIKFDIKTEQESGLKINIDKENTSLKDQIINNKPIKISGKAGITITDATYVFVDEPKVNLILSFKVEKCKYIKVKMENTFKPSYTYSQPMPDTLKDWVKEIEIKALKIPITIKNRLPENNNLGIKISSKVFGLNSQADFPSSQEEITKTIERTDFIFKPGDVQNGYIDITTEINFPGGYDENSKILTINNVEPGKEVSLGGRIKIELDWTKAKITPKTNNTFEGQFPEQGSEAVNLSKIREFTKGKIRFKDINVYLYIDSPVLDRPDTKMRGKVYASYSGKGTPQIIPILGNQTDFENIKFKKLPESFLNRDKNKPYIGKFEDASIKPDLSKILNDAPEDLKVFYDLNLEELEVKSEDLKNAGGTKLNADLLLEIPINLEIEEDTEIIKKDWENSLSSTSEADGDAVGEVMSAVRDITMTAEYENGTSLQVAAEIIFKNQDGKELLKKDLKLLKGNNKLELEIKTEDAQKLKDEKKLFTEFKIVLPKGTYKLEEGSAIKIKASISSKLKLDKSFKIF